MSITGWRTWVYCATCDGSVRPDATVCPHCGSPFGVSNEGWRCPCGRLIEPSDVRRHASECDVYDGSGGY